MSDTQGQGEYWIVRGPCKASMPEEGEANGWPVAAGTTIVVPIGRSLLVKSSAPPKGTCRVEPIEPSVYESYSKYSSDIAEEGERIVIVGPSDSGKTTLSSFILSRLGRARYITVDVGQNELYAPAFEASIAVSKIFVPGADTGYDPDRCFVGSFTPSRSIARYLLCVSRLARGAKHIVVDTDGWVNSWEAMESKISLAQAVNADTVVTIGLHQKLIDYLRSETGARIVSLPVLTSGRGKSRDDRRTHRERLVAKALAGAREFSLSPGETPVYGSPVFVGDPISREDLEALSKSLEARIIHGERTPEGLVLVVRARRRLKLQGARILQIGWEKGLVAASIPGEGKPCMSLVTGIDYRRGKIRLLAPCKPRSVVLGRDRVSLEGYKGITP